jgi:outer membrane biosynthesis protein TonB
MEASEGEQVIGMQKIPIGAGLVIFLASFSIQSLAQAPFKPAEVISAGDIPYPVQSIADGVVVLDVSLDEKGAITRTTVVRDIPSLTSAATSSVQSWKFSPASMRGKPEQSLIRVAVVFRPRAYFAAGPAFTPILSERGSNRADQTYIPPGIVSVSYPLYPINAAAPGTVVIQVTVGRSSAVQRLRVVRDLPPFTQVSVRAVNKWRFQTATLDGKPVASALGVGFVFAPLPAD